MSSLLAQRARAILGTVPEPDSIEECWERAALETVARNQQVMPDRARLRELAAPARVWTNLPAWPAERIQARLAALLETARLAVGDLDVAWLAEIDKAWLAIPTQIEDSMTVLRARGELGLALGAQGSRPSGWNDEEIAALREDEVFVSGAPADEAWQALATGDVRRAKRALESLRQTFAAARHAWDHEEAALLQIRAHPASVLDIEGRALDTLIARVAPR